jgi:hypothetical protein
MLIRIAQRDEPDACGISLDAAGRVPLDDNVRNNILTCLYDLDTDENRWGLWFSYGLLAAHRCDADIKKALIDRLPSFMGSPDYNVRAEAINVLICLRKAVPQYREWMLRALGDPYHGVRLLALVNCTTFLRTNEIEPLLKLKDDDWAVEISMGGPLVYSLRNEALEQLERMLGKAFWAPSLSETIEEDKIVSWRDWTLFLRWWNAPWRRWWRFMRHKLKQK